MRRALIPIAAVLGTIAAHPAAAQSEQSYERRDGFGHNVQQRRPQLKTPLVTWDVTLRQDGKYFWSGPLTVSLDNQLDEVTLTQGADCDQIILAFAEPVAPPAGVSQGDYRYQGAMLTLGLRAETFGDKFVQHTFTLRLSRGEPAPDALPETGDRCDADPWQFTMLDWTSQFTMPDAPSYRIEGPRGFSVEFRRHGND